MSDEMKRCKDCVKFRQPHWISDRELGICSEGMFGDGEASDKNDSACEHYEEKDPNPPATSTEGGNSKRQQETENQGHLGRTST